MLTVRPWRAEARERLRVLLDREDVGMLEDAPHLPDRVEVDRRRSPELVPDRVGIRRIPTTVQQVQTFDHSAPPSLPATNQIRPETARPMPLPPPLTISENPSRIEV